MFSLWNNTSTATTDAHWITHCSAAWCIDGAQVNILWENLSFVKDCYSSFLFLAEGIFRKFSTKTTIFLESLLKSLKIQHLKVFLLGGWWSWVTILNYSLARGHGIFVSKGKITGRIRKNFLVFGHFTLISSHFAGILLIFPLSLQ